MHLMRAGERPVGHRGGDATLRPRLCHGRTRVTQGRTGGRGRRGWRRILIGRFTRDRVGAAPRKRPPLDGDPTADSARARPIAPGAASGLGRVKWLEPESESEPEEQ